MNWILVLLAIIIIMLVMCSSGIIPAEYEVNILSQHIIELDYRKGDITTTATSITLADRTVASAELWADANGTAKNGSNSEIAFVKLIAEIIVTDTSGSTNELDCSTATDNQWQISDDNTNFDDCPFPMHGSLSGQHADGDLECQSNGGNSATFIADISDLTNSTYEEDADARYVLRLQNARADVNNLHIEVKTFLRISYIR